MLTALRTRFAVLRKSLAPVASLLDFGLWTLRYALPPNRPKSWFVAGIAGAGLALGIATALPGAFVLFATLAFIGAVILMLVLSYTRTLIATQHHQITLLKEAVWANASAVSAEAPASAPGRAGAGPPLLAGRGTDWEILALFAESHDRLRAEVEGLARQLEALEGEDLPVMRTELAALRRRLDRAARLNGAWPNEIAGAGASVAAPGRVQRREGAGR